MVFFLAVERTVKKGGSTFRYGLKAGVVYSYPWCAKERTDLQTDLKCPLSARETETVKWRAALCTDSLILVHAEREGRFQKSSWPRAACRIFKCHNQVLITTVNTHTGKPPPTPLQNDRDDTAFLFVGCNLMQDYLSLP